jgi:hypothetical protein
VQTVKQECHDYLLLFGEAHLRYLLKVFLDYYHGLRPHQGIGNVPICGSPPLKPADGVPVEVEWRALLGGPLKSYQRKAA